MKNSQFFGIFFQIHTTTEAFFFKKKKGALILLKIGSDEVQSK